MTPPSSGRPHRRQVTPQRRAESARDAHDARAVPTRAARSRPGARRAADARAEGRHAPQGKRAASAQNGAEPVRQRRMRYIPALDGVRTLAVIAVVLYHLNLSWAQGGLLGVTMFFVLSGYLITRLLLAEYDQAHRIDLKDFWLRRVRRLVPAVVTVVVVTALLCTLFNHVMLTKMRPDIVPSLLFFNNWWQIFNNVSYFNALGDPSPLTHFWSLAIEEQFYLVWPPLLFAMLRVGARRQMVRRVVLGLAVVSAAAMMVLYNPALDPSRVYYGTDTRAFALLLGAWLAFVPERSMGPAHLLRLVRRQPAPAGGDPVWQADAMGAVGLIGLVLITVFTNGYTSFQYQGGMLLTTLLTMMVIAAAVQEGGLVARVLSLPPLVWLGQRSYSIYLWHYPLLLLMNPVANINETPWWMTLIQLAVVVAAAELSYRLVETPCRKGALGAFVRRVRTEGVRPAGIVRAYPVRSAVVGLVFAVALGGLALVPPTSALSAEGAALLADGEASVADDAGAGGEAAGESSAGDTDGAASGEGAAQAAPERDASGFPAGSYDVLMIGDSVSLRAVSAFDAAFPHGHIDAAKSRQFTAGAEAYASYVQQNLAGKIAVFALGTNGLVTDEAIDSLMATVGEDRIAVFVNTRSPQPWVQATNDALARAPQRYANARVIDWFGYSAGRNDLFDGDGTHLSASGAQEYVNLIYENVKADLPLHPEDHANDPAVVAVHNALNQSAAALAPKAHALGAGDR
ncbi:acyltransferase [Collinsella intestinalis]|nr:acyltransferase [Collinsella intestinalis]